MTFGTGNMKKNKLILNITENMYNLEYKCLQDYTGSFRTHFKNQKDK